jgi:hypothetical protein
MIIWGELKSNLRIRGRIIILQQNGVTVTTDVIRRCGPGWLITDHALYSVSIQSPSPNIPDHFVDVLKNCFPNEGLIREHLEALLETADELRDFPLSRENGYAEFMSRELVYALKDHAELACEGDYSADDALVAIKASISAQAADMFHLLHEVDYRSRVLLLGTDHNIRAIEHAEQKLHAVAVYADGTVIHCLLRELPIEANDFKTHILEVYSLAQNRSNRQRTDTRYRFPFRPKRNGSSTAKMKSIEGGAIPV